VAPAPAPLASYERLVRAPLSRVWENVMDWEHLPWLHRESFSSIELIEAGRWGWRAHVALPPAGRGARFRLELVRERDAERYVARTLDGAGAGTEIWTSLETRGGEDTRIRVDFHVPGVAAERAAGLGRGFVALYTRLWDQDEAMMRRRELLLSRVCRPRAHPERELDLGPLDALRARLPLRVELGGRPWRVVEVEGELLAHAALCPHWLGPLDEGVVLDGQVVCPWHGYRFDLRSGRCAAHARLALPAAPRVLVDAATSRVRVVLG
jgi:nitrite reductase/ring-hydroxylating ferredoxin subunit